jgi:AraC-like DNA-binding protein
LRAELHGGLVRFAYHHLGVAGPLVRQHADHVLLPTIRFARRYLGADWLPLWVEVPYGAVGGAKDLADRIGVEVRYDRPGLGIVFDRGLLDTPGRCQAPSIAELRRLVGGAADRELTRALIDVVDLRLNNGAVAIDGAARRLGLQPRTLQRRLQAEGRSYRQIVDAARRARAEEALAITSAPIAEIALGLGYDEPAHFTRAFQRWHGCSPSHWRRIRHAATGKAPLAAE